MLQNLLNQLLHKQRPPGSWSRAPMCETAVFQTHRWAQLAKRWQTLGQRNLPRN